MRSFWIFWRRKHKVGEKLNDEDAHELCEKDGSPEAKVLPRRCFLKSRSSGGGTSSTANHTGDRKGTVYRPACSAGTCAVAESSSSDDDDDDEEFDDDEYEGEEVLDAADGEDGDGEEDDEASVTCNVCERSFSSGRRLSQHQQRKGHFCCPVCDALLPSFLALEHHRESLEHWSDDEEYEALHHSRAPLGRQPQRGRRGAADDAYDDDDIEVEEDESSSEEETDSESDGAELDSDSEDLERLL